MSTQHNRPVVEVAVGVLCNQDFAILLGQRPNGKPYAGYWEFPGGKIETGETVSQALARELLEEINIQISDSKEFMVIEHDYPHAYVRLHVCLIQDWQGDLRALENQRLQWVSREELNSDQLPVSPILPAAGPMLEKLKELLNH